MFFSKSTENIIEINNRCEEIAKVCNKYDNLNNSFFIEDSSDLSRGFPFLYYVVDNNQIVGFISVYLLDLLKCEICSFVLPEYRNQKIFSRLFDMFSEDYHGFSVEISTYYTNSTGLHIFQHLGFCYTSTECKMKITKPDFLSIENTGCSFNVSNIDNSLVFQIKKNNQIIGSCNEFLDKHYGVIYEVLIHDAFRGSGYGKQLINYVIDYSLKKCSTIYLHVSKSNKPAYNLYKKIGFQIEESFNYYKIQL